MVLISETASRKSLHCALGICLPKPYAKTSGFCQFLHTVWGVKLAAKIYYILRSISHLLGYIIATKHDLRYIYSAIRF